MTGYPLDTVKVHLQQSSKHTNAFSCARSLYRSGGVCTSQFEDATSISTKLFLACRGASILVRVAAARRRRVRCAAPFILAAGARVCNSIVANVIA